jgi:hypothetical protein
VACANIARFSSGVQRRRVLATTSNVAEDPCPDIWQIPVSQSQNRDRTALIRQNNQPPRKAANAERLRFAYTVKLKDGILDFIPVGKDIPSDNVIYEPMAYGNIGNGYAD